MDKQSICKDAGIEQEHMSFILLFAAVEQTMGYKSNPLKPVKAIPEITSHALLNYTSVVNSKFICKLKRILIIK